VSQIYGVGQTYLTFESKACTQLYVSTTWCSTC